MHDIAQAEGVEQGDPLAPGLYALGQHDSLVAASASLRPDERLAAFLDDLYVVTVPERAAPLPRVVTSEVERGAGVEANLGKTRVFNAAGGDAPPGVDVLGPDVWCGNLPPEQRGFVALGVPIGHTDFVKAQAANRLDAEADLLRKLMQLPDVQCAWLLLAFCAAPRAQHLLRNVPPADILPYARGHDDAVWAVVEGLLGDQGPGEGDDWAAARQVAFLPPSLGGLGLLAAERVSPAAYWAAWADVLPVLRQRYPDAAARLVQELEGEPAAPCLRAAAEAARQLAAEGWTSRPEWASCARGADAPAAEGELGLGIPGWQRHAVLALHTSFRERVLLPALAPAARALLHSQSGHLLHSQSGPHAGMWLAAIPSDAAFPCTRPDARRHEAPPSAALAPHGPALWRGRPTWLHVGLRSMRTGTTTSPAHARACCPGVVSSLKGRGFRLLARRSARKVGSCRSSGCRGQQRRRFTPTTGAASTSLSTEQRAAAKPCAATQPSSPPLLALAAPSPVPTRGRESRLSRRADAKSRATRS